jgi:tryptophan 2,3-dioxygenase
MTRPDSVGQRRDCRRLFGGSVAEEVAHAASMLTAMAQADEDFDTPILPGDAPSDYERYINTDELLALQKGPDEWVHRDELLFQVVHQSSELWLKLATSDVEEAARLTDAGLLAEAARQLRRPLRCLRYTTDQLDMLEEMSPWEYQEIRKVLGHGSGFDSPGWRSLREAMPRLGQAFHARRREAGLSLTELYVQRADHDSLYRLAESLTELDEWCQMWRVRHYRVVARVIGDAVVGTQGTPVEVLGRLVQTVFFPELWDVRNELTARSKAESTAS